MPTYPTTPRSTNRHPATMRALGLPNSAPPPLTPQIPNTPTAVLLAPGAGSNLTVTWTAPAIDGTHSAAAGFNLQSSPSGMGSWTTIMGVSSPYTLSGLAASATIDVQIQSSNACGLSTWSVSSMLTTATAAPNTPGVVSLVR